MAAPSLLKQRMRVFAPAATITVSIVTLISCVLIAKANDIYLSGLVWPYFSDTGRDPPAYYVFCVGLTIGAVLTAISWYCNHEYQMIALRHAYTGKRVPRRWTTIAGMCRGLGMLSAIGLPILAIFDVSAHFPIHLIGAFGFFCLECVAICINTFLSKKIYSLATKASSEQSYVIMDSHTAATDKTQQRRKRTVLAQFGLCIVFFVGFTIYIPIGSAVSGCERLTVTDCLAKNLGDDYCTIKMRLDDNLTTLYSCEDNFANAQMAAIGQLFSVLALIGYTMTFLFHDYKDSARVIDMIEATSAE